jgi:hypothetical protein
MSKYVDRREVTIMNIESLLARTNNLRSFNTKDGMTETYVTGVEYSEWIYECRIFLEETYSGKSFTSDFLKESQNAVGNGIKHLDIMEGILRAVMKAQDDGIIVPDSESLTL